MPATNRTASRYPARPIAYTHGKCTPCRAYYQWEGKPLLRDARCPRCSQPLERTCKGHLPGVIFERVSGESVAASVSVSAIRRVNHGDVRCTPCGERAERIGFAVESTRVPVGTVCAGCGNVIG